MKHPPIMQIVPLGVKVQYDLSLDGILWEILESLSDKAIAIYVKNILDGYSGLTVDMLKETTANGQYDTSKLFNLAIVEYHAIDEFYIF